ncbi:MAG: helix-turn-helix domain-containing protein [Gemmataceae bacterium]|nr:helix-turn-helix domain-containing protein [Gemmataceae bacterium]
MNAKKRKALEAAGFRFGDAEDFLGLSAEERELVELRLAVSRAVRRLREEQRLTQKDLADRLKTSQPRVVRIESGAADVSLDLMFRGFFAVRGSLRDLVPARASRPLKPQAQAPRPVKVVKRKKPVSHTMVPIGV